MKELTKGNFLSFSYTLSYQPFLLFLNISSSEYIECISHIYLAYIPLDYVVCSYIIGIYGRVKSDMRKLTNLKDYIYKQIARNAQILGNDINKEINETLLYGLKDRNECAKKHLECINECGFEKEFKEEITKSDKKEEKDDFDEIMGSL